MNHCDYMSPCAMHMQKARAHFVTRCFLLRAPCRLARLRARSSGIVLSCSIIPLVDLTLKVVAELDCFSTSASFEQLQKTNHPACSLHTLPSPLASLLSTSCWGFNLYQRRQQIFTPLRGGSRPHRQSNCVKIARRRAGEWVGSSNLCSWSRAEVW